MTFDRAVIDRQESALATNRTVKCNLTTHWRPPRRRTRLFLRPWRVSELETLALFSSDPEHRGATIIVRYAYDTRILVGGGLVLLFKDIFQILARTRWSSRWMVNGWCLKWQRKCMNRTGRDRVWPQNQTKTNHAQCKQSDNYCNCLARAQAKNVPIIKRRRTICPLFSFRTSAVPTFGLMHFFVYASYRFSFAFVYRRMFFAISYFRSHVLYFNS